ncbi:MAG: hypothetical protein K1X89_31520, partial [Myxococcaceae bacterium]|nr:hypothetical protein [Myxococcaceae bacterium]
GGLGGGTAGTGGGTGGSAGGAAGGGGLGGGAGGGMTDAGRSDGGTFDAGTQDAGPVTAIRFGGGMGLDGLFTTQHANPDLRTVAGWFRLRVNVPTTRQECVWSFEDDAPSSAYQLMVNTFQMNQWESHDRSEGGFLFAPVDLGWWFVAETNRAAGPATALYWKKEGASALNVTTGNTHPAFPNATRFLVGTDDATGQNEWTDGDIAGIKVWNAELSKAELELEAQRLSPVRTLDLFAYYPLQTVATMLQDQSGNGRNLSPIYTGGTWSQQTGPAIPR